MTSCWPVTAPTVSSNAAPLAIVAALYCSLPSRTRSAFFVRMKCLRLRFSRNLCIFRLHCTGETPALSFFVIKFYFTKMNTEVNERLLKNTGMHRSIRHRWFQAVPISFSLAKVGVETVRFVMQQCWCRLAWVGMWQRTKVRRYSWHSAASLGWPFPMLKY